MSLSITFSIVIYSLAYSEVQSRLGRFQSTIQQYGITIHGGPLDFEPESFKAIELSAARDNLLTELFYVNIVVLLAGGFISYLLAQKNLKPIQRAHEAQSRFTSDASHELRTPLAVMKTEIEVALRDKKSTNDDLRTTLSSNLEEVDKLSRLASMLLELSKLDSGNLEFDLFNFTKATTDIIDGFRQPVSRINFVGKKQVIVNGNETALQDLVKILIDNALKYSPKKSKITVKLSTKQRLAVLEVKNTGPGIKPDKIEHIFDRFFRTDDSRTSHTQKSYGLGLSLAKKIVDTHNGEIIAISKPDVETIFIAKVPLNNSIQANSKN